MTKKPALYIFILLLIGAAFPVLSLIEAPDGSVCFNQCSGHGDCIDYSCHCHVGYLGDDCSTTFARGDRIVPILTAGHFNVTRKNITQTVSKHKHLLIGFSSYACHKCIQPEPEYEDIAKRLTDMQIPFARANADEMKSIAVELGATDLPAIVFLNKMRPTVYRGVHSSDAVIQYVTKMIGPTVKKLKSVQDVEDFFSSRRNKEFSVSTVMAVGFFSEHDDVEEDDYEDFLEVAKDLQVNEDIYFGVVTNPSICKQFKEKKLIDRTPSILMIGDSDDFHSINLDEFYGEKFGVKEWLLKKSIPLVGKITGANFGLYEKLNIPMLLMFLDLTDADHSSQPGKIVGGRSGNILNEILIEELKNAAKEHVDRIVFGYIDGTLYTDQMRSLGLYGGKERLPSLAFNTRDGSQVPFPEELAINSETILQFCADFLSGKLRNIDDTKEMAKKALQKAIPLSSKNKAVRKDKQAPPKVVQGVSEQFGDGIRGDNAVITVSSKNFDDIVMNEEKDVVLLLHTKSCETCSHFNVYYKRMAERFQALQIPSLLVAQMDVTDDAPPAHLNMLVGAFPLLLMVPAQAKYPPWNYFSGVGKVQPMMKWVQKHSSIPFDLPNLPHLTEKDRIAYKEQVRQREEALEQKRKDEKKAMEEEERAKAEVLRRQRKREREANKLQLQQEGLEPVNVETNASPDANSYPHPEGPPSNKNVDAEDAYGDDYEDIFSDRNLEDHDEF